MRFQYGILLIAYVANSGYTDGAYGYAKTSEGSQYKYYVDSNIVWDSSNTNLVKCDVGSASGNWWWLRSPYYGDSDLFCRFNGYGNLSSGSIASLSIGVAPGFAI